MLKGLSITPPILGRISIGKVVERSGKRLPEKDDQFTITSQIQNQNGWLPHPVDEGFRQQQGGKLRSIPIRLLFNDPDLNFRAEYSLFDRTTGRPLCVGNGETAKGVTTEGMKEYPCPSPAACELGRKGGCKPYGRLNVSIGDEDPLGSFIFRTTSFNSIRTLTARLQYFRAISRNRLSCLPLELRLRGKSTRQSHGTPIYYVDVTVRTGLSLEESLVEAKRIEEQRQAAGFDQEALELSARQGLANGAFEESDDECGAVVEEFFPATSGEGDTVAAERASATATVPDSLAEKLAVKAHNLGLVERQA